ncbi:MAG: M10 family metallopeptidase C-terminal domain-containing protein [Rhodoplanes sp.]|uniref:M10 family metallopeptidase C-terminal domain-containing protein n=1 Tax=Rhodoplanes sp. TaxID=1968906 RepID=UPI001849FDCB|nr:M10 family metallopeptidase C-terminal domain-containing protein [Rhodoplanes sp.]NVO17946.1 M10 family metallopeptidase C-terminal domain-containing protein [Rhodoplanes sp.]
MPYILPNVVESSDAAAGTATVYAIGIGQTAQGTLSTTSDHDWYRVSLVAGQTYSFALVGTGTNNVADTYLTLRNAAGTLIAADDDSGPGHNSTITFTATTTGTYYLDAGSYNNQSAGQYGLSASVGTRPNYDIPMGGGAIDSDASWSSPGTPVIVTYGFRDAAPSYTVSGSDISTFSRCSAAEMAAVQSILQMWSDVCGITFQLVNPGGYTNNATILIGNYYDPNDGAGAFAFYPGSTASTASAGDLWLNLDSVSTTSIPYGSYSWFAIMHELGHAMGLSHPGDYNAGPGVSITYANAAQFTQDTEQYSVMSYFAGSYTGQSPGGFATAQTPMLLDIYELQQIYGANMSTRTGDTIYGFGGTAGSIYDFSVNTAPQLCIWDAGGTDTLNCSGYGQNQLINLNAGTVSNIGGETGNISIALGAVIENAIGGSGDDTILGNDANNRLDGGAGNDVLIGGPGDDTAIFTGAFTAYQCRDLGNHVTVSGIDGFDALYTIEHMQFTDGRIDYADGDPLFDTIFYMQQNIDVYHAGVDGRLHYNAYGWHEGRNPDPYFSTAGYIGYNRDVDAAHINPLTHYNSYGWHEGRDPGSLFDTDFYLIHNPDVRAAGLNPLAHYLEYGISEGREIAPAVGRGIAQTGIDDEYYDLTYRDVALAHADVSGHYNTYGWHEGRNPNAYFDTAGYLARYADVRAAGINPLTHYMQYGWQEGRNPSANFDTHDYLAHNPDVAAAHINPLLHYLVYGLYEGRVPYADELFA